jgi:hypothetical protein
VSNNTAIPGGGVFVYNSGTFTMSGGSVSNNTASSFGGGVFVDNSGTFTMSGGAVSNNTASEGGVFVYYGSFTMSGGSVSNNTASSFGGGVFVYNSGTFKLSGDARPERVFLSNSSNSFITIAGALSGPVIPIDLGIGSSAPLTGWAGKQILRLDSSYSGNLAILKSRFSLGNAQLTHSPYTAEALTGYVINDGGVLTAVP